MSNPTQVELAASNVKGQHPDNDPARYSPSTPRWAIETLPDFHYLSRFQPGSLVIDIVADYESDTQQAEQEYAQRQLHLKQHLTEQVQGLTGPLHGLLELQAVTLKLDATRQLLAQKQAALGSARQTALAFYGTDPLGKNITDYFYAANRPQGSESPRHTWLASYKAAFETRLLATAVDHLTSDLKNLEIDLQRAQLGAERAQKLEQKIDQLELKLRNFDLARHDHDAAMRALQQHLEQFSRHQDAALTPPPEVRGAKALEAEIAALLAARKAVRAARFQVDNHGMRLTIPSQLVHTALRQAEAAHTAATTLARGEALWAQSVQAEAGFAAIRAEIDRQTVEISAQAMAAVDAVQLEQARLAALDGSEAHQRPATFNLSAAPAALPQVITPAASSMAAFAAIRSDLKTSLRQLQPLLKGTPGKIAQAGSVLLFSLRLGHDERYGLSVPFTDLYVDIDWQDVLAEVGESFPVPLRLVSGLVGRNAHIQAVPTGVEDIPTGVPVRAATWDEQQGAWRFTTDGPGPVTIFWTPATSPGDSSTALPAETPTERSYPGFISVPAVPELMPLPASDDLHFDDYIITFPADSGLEPVYIMFKNPRDFVGTGSGNGKNISGWEEAIYGASGAPLPTRIADQLRGRAFSRWAKMREAIWKAIAADPELSRHFDEASLENMQRGGAAFSSVTGQVGKKMVLELHHVHPIVEGGGVYDLDNLMIMTPRAHINTHKKEKP